MLRVISIWVMHYLSRYVLGEWGWNPAREAMMWFLAVLMALSARFGWWANGATYSSVRRSAAAVLLRFALFWLSMRMRSSWTLRCLKKSTALVNAAIVALRGSQCREGFQVDVTTMARDHEVPGARRTRFREGSCIVEVKRFGLCHRAVVESRFGLGGFFTLASLVSSCFSASAFDVCGAF
jgi:hypothetical protein